MEDTGSQRSCEGPVGQDKGRKERVPTATGGAGGLSFTFQKIKSGSRVRPKGEQDGEDKDFVLSVEGKEIHSVKPKPEKKEFVVPLIRKNVWRMPGGKKDGSRNSETHEEGGEGRNEDDIALEREAAEAILKDVQDAKLRVLESKDDGVVVPLVMQNKPPPVEGREGDELADVELRPEQSSLQDYESMPIEVFGEAVLRGMGWKKGEPIGKTNKGLSEPIEFIPRVGGLGLGATPKAPEKKPGRIRKPGETERKVQGPYVDSQGRVRHVKKVGEEIPEQPPQGFGVGRCVWVARGPHEGLYGKIVGLDEDNSRVILRLTINKQDVSLSQHQLELVDEEEYRRNGRSSGAQPVRSRDKKAGGKRYGLITKKDGESRSPSPYKAVEEGRHPIADDPSSNASMRTSEPGRHGLKRTDGDRDDVGSERPVAKRRGQDSETKSSRSHSKGSGGSHRYREAKGASLRSEYDESKWSSSSAGSRHWLAPNLRVRIVDRKYKRGLYYNTKVVVIDVISIDTCICQTDDGKLLEDVKERMLETVVPRAESAVVMVVGRERNRQIGTILKRDKANCKVAVELVQTREVVTLDYDDVCEYVGNIEELM